MSDILTPAETEIIAGLLVELSIDPTDDSIDDFTYELDADGQDALERAAAGNVGSIAYLRDRCGLPNFV